MPKFSIIVPVYKVEQFLGKCIESILKQSFIDWELLLIDDGSPDNSGQICDVYAEKDPRIRVFHKANGGVGSARNLGLDEACGEWIMFVDSDDWLSSDCLEQCIVEINQNELDALQFGYNSVYSDKEIQYLMGTTEIRNGEDYIKNGFFNVCVWGGVYKFDIIKSKNIRFNTKLKLAEDQLFILTFLQYSQRVKYLNSVLYYYFQRSDSAVHNQKSVDILLSCQFLISLSHSFPAAKAHIDNMIVLFIIEMLKNKDVPYHTLEKLYKSQCVDKVTNGSRIHQIFPKLAVFSFPLTCLMVSLYMRMKLE